MRAWQKMAYCLLVARVRSTENAVPCVQFCCITVDVYSGTGTSFYL